MNSSLFDEKTFYSTFLRDLEGCRNEVIIESPYITSKRAELLIPIFESLLLKGVKIYVMTRDPKEHEENMEYQSEDAISQFERMGVQVLLCIGNHHRKLAILDRKTLWEGSLNILSQNKSREIMRRIESEELAIQMFEFLKLGRFI
ncbi:MAG TPA: phospholipase D-like domain-containing protein [Patescibacteria group bacterium]|nr:phospholipase D-like domain-containing protein [Patescibacteria group bacterium]